MNRKTVNVKNILLVAIARLGDMLQASPTIAGLKKQNPGAKITVLTDKEFASICNGIPGIDEVYQMDLAYLCRNIQEEKEGIVQGYAYLKKTVDELRGRKFDFCVNMSSSPYTSLLIKLIDVEQSRGWLADDEGNRLINEPWAMLFGAYIFHSNREYNSINLVDIMRASAGVTEHPTKLQFNIPEDYKNFGSDFIAQSALTGKGPLILMQVGASQMKRQWSPARFAYLTRLLVEKFDARIVFTGSASEVPIIQLVLSQYNHSNLTVAAGKTNLMQLASLLSAGDVFITGDTGPMHLSVAVGTPVVALFLASAYLYETGPYSIGNLVIQPQIACNPCNPNFLCARPDCHGQVSPELVAYLTHMRLTTPLGQEHTISIPSNLASPNDVQVYYSAFDKENFLEFVPLTSFPVRHGKPGEYYEAARKAYRELWKKELGPGETQVLDAVPKEAALYSIDGIEQAIEYSKEGIALIEQLRALVNDPKSSPTSLGQVGFALEVVDRKIKEVGLTTPALGALARMFVSAKENLEGKEINALVRETKQLYETTMRRAAYFDQMFTKIIRGENHASGN